MKLYATTTSERATKGQGGNTEIVIDLTIHPTKRKLVGRVVMRYEEPNGYRIYYYPITETTGKGGRILLHEELVDTNTTKGEKQKGENDTLICTEKGCKNIQGSEMEFCIEHYR